MAITVTFPLQDGSGGTDEDMALERFSGIVSRTFEAKTKFWDDTGNIYMTRSIDSGNSAQFPQVGFSPDPEFHDGQGADVTRNTVTSNEMNVAIDDEIVQTIAIPVKQRNMAHWDVVATHLPQLTYSIANEYDQIMARVLALAARTSNVTDVHNGGNRVTRDGTGTDFANAYPTSVTGANNLRDDVAELAYLMDVDNVPKEGRILFVDPYFKRVIRYETDVFDANLSDGPLPNDIVRRSFMMLEGFTVIETNNLPSTNVNSGPSAYQGDFRTAGTNGRPIALAAAGGPAGVGALGVVGLADMEILIDDRIRRITNRAMDMQAAMQMGVGIVNPYCAGEIAVLN